MAAVGKGPHFLQKNPQQNFLATGLELGVFKVHLRLMTLGSLGNGIHSHWKFCDSLNLQRACINCNLMGLFLNKNNYDEGNLFFWSRLRNILDAPSQFKTFDH